MNSSPCATCYPSYDYLGSVRMVTDGSGNVMARHDYFPFGEEIAGGSYQRGGVFGGVDGMSQRFTGQERDSENTPSLDYFGARYMSSVLGRFMSADPGSAGADLMNPQSWNGYGYVLGNPLIFVDPSGQVCVFVGKEGDDLNDPSKYKDDDNVAQNCSQAFNPSSNGAISATSTTNISDVPTYQDFSSFYNLWNAGRGPATINYGPNDGMTKALAASLTFDSVRHFYIAKGCPSDGGTITSGHLLPAFEGYVSPLMPEAGPNYLYGSGNHSPQQVNLALIQVGGFYVNATTSGNTTTFTINNDLTNASFLGGTTFGYSVGNDPSGPTGPRHTIKQQFTFSESNVCKK